MSLNNITGFGVENTIKLNRFKPRPYQMNLCKEFESLTLKKYLIVWPRRARQRYMLP